MTEGAGVEEQHARRLEEGEAAGPVPALGEVQRGVPATAEAAAPVPAPGEVQRGVPATAEVHQGIPVVQQGIPTTLPGAPSSEQPPPLVHGYVVGRPALQPAAPPSLPSAGNLQIQIARATGLELTDAEVIVLNYRASLMIFASIDFLATVLNVVLVIMNYSEMPGGLHKWSDLLWLAFLAGPICGLVGAKRLKKDLVVVYFSFCVVKSGYELAWAFITLRIWHIVTMLVQIWVTKIVFTFWRSLSAIPPERCRQLLAQKSQIAMVCW